MSSVSFGSSSSASAATCTFSSAPASFSQASSKEQAYLKDSEPDVKSMISTQKTVEFLNIQKVRYAVADREHAQTLKVIESLNNFNWPTFSAKGEGLNKHWEYYYKEISDFVCSLDLDLRSRRHEQCRQLPPPSIEKVALPIIRNLLPQSSAYTVDVDSPQSDGSQHISQLITDWSIADNELGVDLCDRLVKHLPKKANVDPSNFTLFLFSSTAGSTYLNASDCCLFPRSENSGKCHIRVRYTNTTKNNSHITKAFRETIGACVAAEFHGIERRVDIECRYEEAKTWYHLKTIPTEKLHLIQLKTQKLQILQQYMAAFKQKGYERAVHDLQTHEKQAAALKSTLNLAEKESAGAKIAAAGKAAAETALVTEPAEKAAK